MKDGYIDFSEDHGIGIIVAIPDDFTIERYISIREQAVGIQVEGKEKTVDVRDLTKLFKLLLEDSVIYGDDLTGHDKECVYALICLLKELDLVITHFQPVDENVIVLFQDVDVGKYNEIKQRRL